MAEDPIKLMVLPYVQYWNATSGNLSIRLLLVPRDSFIVPYATTNPTSPAFFPNVSFKFIPHVRPGLREYPILGSGETAQPITLANDPSYATVFKTLTASFGGIINTTPTAKQRARDPADPDRTIVRKHLPGSYRDATRYTPSGNELFSTDESYSCAMKKFKPRPFKKPEDKPFAPSWGELIASILRIPDFAALAGFIRICDFEVPAAKLTEGAYVWFELDNTTATTIGVDNTARVKTFAARILPRTSSGSLFSTILFDVGSVPTTVPLDVVMKEADNFHDGWAKAVHGMQPKNGSYLTERPNDDRPSRDIGIRLGWDDEQVTIWADRLMDPQKKQYDDFPLGVRGYRVDVQQVGTNSWFSLSRANGKYGVKDMIMGNITHELGVEVHPAKSLLTDGDQKEFWLPMYFANWTQPSLVGTDVDASMIVGRPQSTNERVTKGVSDPALQLRYGRKYQFRVRLMDQTGGGPSLDSPTNAIGPSPTSTVMFSRWVKPLAPVLVGQTPSLKDELGADNSAEVSRLEFRRPPMTYPAVLYTGYPNAIQELKAQAEELARLPKDPRYRNAVSEPNLPDPDVQMVEITVLVQTAPQDPLAEDGPYLKLYTTTRTLPTDLKASVQVPVTWQDAPSIWDPPAPWNSAATSGPLLLPTQRTLRLRVNALCRKEPNPDTPYFGADDVRRGPQLVIPLRKSSNNETGLYAVNVDSYTLNGLFLQPQLDTVSRLAEAVSLRSADTKLKGLAGKRVIFACASSLLHLVGPDRGSLSFTSHADLALRWIVVIRLNLKRDWTWDGLPLSGIQVKRDGKPVLSTAPVQAVNEDALAGVPDRSGSDIVIVDVVDPKPEPGQPGRELTLKYDISTTFVNKTAPTSDPPISATIRLPSTTAPTQLCELTSVGLAMSPYVHDKAYSSTSTRKKMLWVAFGSAPQDPSYRYFGRVLKYAPDPMLMGPQSLPTHRLDWMTDAPEPPLPLDPELIRRIVPKQSTDYAGLDAMQELIPTSSPLHYGLPLPASLREDSLELFGFWTYEFRIGRGDKTTWCTAQARFGPPLRVAGVQHPPPQLICSLNRDHIGITVSAPLAQPMLNGRRAAIEENGSEMWFLLYAQAAQIDGGVEKRNILVGRVKGAVKRADGYQAPGTARAYFARENVNPVLDAYGLKRNTPLSALAVELYGQVDEVTDPLGGDLGRQRILRTSNLVGVPAMC